MATSAMTTMAPTSTWETKVLAKQQGAREKIPREWFLPASLMQALKMPIAKHQNRVIDMDIPRKSGILTERELEITENYTVEELLSKLKSGHLSSLEVTVAFSKRAAMAQQLLSCLTETYFSEAQERARFLDDERAQGRIVGPLHGLPISIKDSFQVVGSAATIGFVSFMDNAVSDRNSALVDILLELGAVVYVKTNIPQTMMTADSHNNIFGRTLNPHNTSLTAGGSSGGEGALVAFRGSPLGSIRIPALCCGTYGFKPSASRVPFGGQASPVREGQSFFLPTAGPLANDLQALDVLCRSVMSARPALYDSTALDIPWRDLPKATPTKLRIGVLSEDPFLPLHPPVKRAVAEAVKLLEAQGHSIHTIPHLAAYMADSVALSLAFFGIDDAHPDHIAEGGEPPVPSVKQAGEAFAAISTPFLDDCANLTGISRLLALNIKREAIAEEWREMWKEQKLDAVIGPAAQHTAVPHDTFGLPPYTLLLNLLDASLHSSPR
ncbi:general amidase-b [Stemphylium lycopersici]|nr:general amidase-b [Stemphylium lycopersici]